MLLTTGAYTIMQALRPDLPVNLLRDFEPVAPIGSLSFLLLAKHALPVKSLDDLIKLARAKPGQDQLRLLRASAPPPISAARCSRNSPTSTSCTCPTRARVQRSPI